MMATVFLDLDGTLTDPKPGITHSVAHALESLDRVIGPPPRALLGQGLSRIFETLVAGR